jgi:hypothetical protein
VVIVPTDTVTTRSKPSGKNQLRLLQELERLAEVKHSVWTENQLRDIAKALGMARNRAQEALLGLRTTGYLVATVGGSHLPHVTPRRPNAFSDASGVGVRGRPNLDVSDQVAETSGTTGRDDPPSELSESVRKPKSGRDPHPSELSDDSLESDVSDVSADDPICSSCNGGGCRKCDYYGRLKRWSVEYESEEKPNDAR